MNNILYSTHCPQCQVLEKKLNQKNISYKIHDNVDEMKTLGIKSAPVLVVDGKNYNFTEAIQWVNKQ